MPDPLTPEPPVGAETQPTPRPRSGKPAQRLQPRIVLPPEDEADELEDLFNDLPV